MARMEWKVRAIIGFMAGICLLFLTFIALSNGQFVNHTVQSENDVYGYGIIIDAGSTGSRLFLYRWKSIAPNELIKIEPVLDENNEPIVKKVSPGLSTFGAKPSEAPVYILPLIHYAYGYIPAEQRDSAAFYLFATAGMRLLPLEQQEAVIKSLQTGLPKLTKLTIVPENIKVIDGTWEGIYNWIAVNYILERFQTIEEKLPVSGKSRKSTVGMIDMGGASTQIAFELPDDSFKSDVQVINLGAVDTDESFRYHIFVTTFLGFGVNEGAKKYENYLRKQVTESFNTTTEITYVRDGCLPINLMKLVTNDDGTQFLRKGTGEWDTCVRSIAKILTDEPPKCPPLKQCYFGGVVAPPVQLSTIELYGFSEYWYSVEDVLALGGVYNHSGFEERARGFCSQRWPSIKARAKAQRYPKANEERLETQCFKSAWIHAILHDGFFVDENRHKFQSANKIHEQEVQWALGAMIYHQRYFPLVHKNILRSDFTEFNWSTLIVMIFIVILILFVIFIFYYQLNKKSSRKAAALFSYDRLFDPESVQVMIGRPRTGKNRI
uniref:Apyrase n=1 Tax=Panagrolaimus sp. JU765 TaxID=591449 RepID=A0AC34QC15_9BILA